MLLLKCSSDQVVAHTHTHTHKHALAIVAESRRTLSLDELDDVACDRMLPLISLLLPHCGEKQGTVTAGVGALIAGVGVRQHHLVRLLRRLAPRSLTRVPSVACPLEVH